MTTTSQSNPWKSDTNKSNEKAFAAIREDGSVVAWGNAGFGGDLGAKASLLDGSEGNKAVAIYEGSRAFAAVKEDGSVVTWGQSSFGGDSSSVAEQLTGGDGNKVVQIAANGSTFAALKEDGTVVGWGNQYDSNSYVISTQNLDRDAGDTVSKVLSDSSLGIKKIFTNGGNQYSALTSAGKVISWGSSNFNTQHGYSHNNGASEHLQSGVVDIVSSSASYAALKDDGTVVVWGDEHGGRYAITRPYGHKNPELHTDLSDQIGPNASDDLSPIVQIQANQGAYAALREDGSVVTWGQFNTGGSHTEDSSENWSGQWGASGNVAAPEGSLESGVSKLFSNAYSFAALKNDGSVVSWGRHTQTPDSDLLTDVKDVFATQNSYAAIRNDGSVVTWGGADSNENAYINVVDGLESGAVEIVSTMSAFAAIKADGTVVAWGDETNGGVSDSLSELPDGVTVQSINSNHAAFSALLSDGTVTTWGNSQYGGDNTDTSGLTGIKSFSNHGYEFEPFDLDPAIAFDYKLFRNNSTEALDQLAVLGQGVNESDRYKLEITGRSLLEDYDIESADITLKFNSQIFNNIEVSDVTVGTDLPRNNSIEINNEEGTIRIAAASLAHLGEGGFITADKVLASFTLDFDESSLSTFETEADGSLEVSPLVFNIDANSHETIFSRTHNDGTGFDNRDIKSLYDLEGGVQVEGTNVKLYSAGIRISELDDGLTLGTNRVIGANQGFTNLIRSGDTVEARTQWKNIGNTDANNIRVTAESNTNANLISYRFENEVNSIKGGEFINGEFDESSQETLELVAEISVKGAAGNVLNVSDGLFTLQADDSDVFVNQKGSSNLITYQGDLNYDGRVSMKDLAFLNAGAARQVENDGIIDSASVAHDVDANFDNEINLMDLEVLDRDWGASLHEGTEDFMGSGDSLNWTSLEQQGNATWDNSSFVAQNAIESDAAYIGSLEPPASTTGLAENNDEQEQNNDNNTIGGE